MTHARTFVFRFDQPASVVWSALADTKRWNEAAGLPKHRIREEEQPDGSVRYFAEAKVGVVSLAWEEIPVEWVENRWFRHLRLFSRGPIASLCATATFRETDAGGTEVTYLLEADSANLLGEIVLRTGFFPSAEKTFTRLATDIGDWAGGGRDTPFATAPIELDAARTKRVDTLVRHMEESGNGHGLARAFADWLLSAQEVDVMHIRPLALARRWDVPPVTAIEVVLQAAREGLVDLRWNLLCPRCRGAKVTAPSLDRLPSDAHCPSCNVDYDREFSRNVEAAFRPNPSIRAVIDGEFCLFGPASTPHVKVQVGVDPGQSRTVEANLPAGAYRLRTLEKGDYVDLDHLGGPPPSVEVADGAVRVMVTTSTAGGGFEVSNAGARRRTVIVESREWVEDALVAREVTAMQVFRDLFGEDVLRPGDDVGVSHIALLFTDLRGSTALYESIGDAAAYGLVREHFAVLAGVVRAHRGGIVKTMGDAVMAAFADPADALRCALAGHAAILAFNADHPAHPLEIKVGVHSGPCIAVTMNDRLDYFGTTVNMTARLQAEADAGEVVMSETIASDPGAAEILATLAPTRDMRSIRGFDHPVPILRLSGLLRQPHPPE